jgi:hypothetical protein
MKHFVYEAFQQGIGGGRVALCRMELMEICASEGSGI